MHLIDPVELHLEQARSYVARSGVALRSITRGDARCLDVPSGSADAVLLLGPLYHLVEYSDRQSALREAHRVLKPHGVLFAAAISHFASLIDGLSSGFFGDEEFRKIVAGDLASGQHRNCDEPPSILHDRLLSPSSRSWLPKFTMPGSVMLRYLPSKVLHGVRRCSPRFGMTRFSDSA